MTRFVVVPQWQGSPSSRAMRLRDGAEAIAGDLPRSRTEVLPVPLEAGDALDSGVQRLSAVARVRDDLELLVRGAEEPVVVIGGDCGVAIGAVAAIAAADVAVVWFDAHADANTADTSPSGAFGGMVLRSILGDGPPPVALTKGVVAPDRVVLAGARSLDLEEELFVVGEGIRMLTPEALALPTALADAVAATGAHRVYVHVDLDVLDPAEISGVQSAEPFGVAAADLVAAVRELRARFPLVGASIAGFAPSSPEAAVDDLGTILRIVGALA